MGVWQGDPLPIPLGVSAVDTGMASISNTMVHCASTSVAYTLMMIQISASLRLPIFNLLVILAQVVMLIPQIVVIECLLIFKLIGIFITCQVRASTDYVYPSAKGL